MFPPKCFACLTGVTKSDGRPENNIGEIILYSMSTIPQVSNKCLSSFKLSDISLCLNRFNAELVFILTKSKSSHDLGFPNLMDFRIIVLLSVWAYRTIMFLEFRVPNFYGSQSAKRFWFYLKV